MPVVETKPTVRFPQLRWGQEVSGLQWENERCIEIPLAQSLLQFWTPGRVLDAGCALNQRFSEPPIARMTHLTLDLAHEDRYPDPNRAYGVADLRDLSAYADQAFDRVGCLSTLEHVGCDNRSYGGAEEADPASVRQAAHELWRVTKDRLFVTVPCYLEPYQEPKWRAFTPETLRMELLTSWPGADVRYYSRWPEGWCGPWREPQPDTSGMSARKVHQVACVLVTR